MTTILAVKRNDEVAIAGDGQVTMGEHVIMKHSAKKSSHVISWKSGNRFCRYRIRCHNPF